MNNKQEINLLYKIANELKINKLKLKIKSTDVDIILDNIYFELSDNYPDSYIKYLFENFDRETREEISNCTSIINRYECAYKYIEMLKIWYTNKKQDLKNKTK